MTEALLGALLPLSLTHNHPGTGVLCISWNLRFLIKGLSPGLNSAGHISASGCEHFSSYPCLSRQGRCKV